MHKKKGTMVEVENYSKNLYHAEKKLPNAIDIGLVFIYQIDKFDLMYHFQINISTMTSRIQEMYILACCSPGLFDRLLYPPSQDKRCLERDRENANETWVRGQYSGSRDTHACDIRQRPS